MGTDRRDHPGLRCPHCQKAGFVRYENVVTGTHAERHFFCGACDHSWHVVDRRLSLPHRGKPPKGAADTTNR